MNVLVCVDHSQASRKVVETAGQLLKGCPNVSVTLFHVAEFLPDFLLADRPEPGMTSRTLAEQWATHARTEGEKVLRESQEALVKAGISESSIARKLDLKDALPESRKVVAALAIITEMQTVGYDLVCIGRRGASEFSGSLIGGVAEKVLREGHGRSVLVVD